MTGAIFCFNDTATTEIYTLSLHDALPISQTSQKLRKERLAAAAGEQPGDQAEHQAGAQNRPEVRPGETHEGSRASSRQPMRSEEHTSELQSRQYLVCRLLLEKKNTHMYRI